MLLRPLAVALLAAPLSFLHACGPDAADVPAPPPPKVLVAEPLVRDVPVYLEAIGQTRGSSEVEIRARVEGFVQAVHFDEGTVVQAGQLLYTIDPLPFEAELARARATRAEAEADLARAHQDVARYAPLVEKNAISREEYETAVAVEKAAGAALEAADALVQSAEIELSYTEVFAPIEGMVGKTEVYPGTLVSKVSNTLMTELSALDPIRARISLSEREYLRFSREREATGREEKPADGAFELLLADGVLHRERGSLVFVDRAVDARSGSILIEISFPNPGGIVRPGQYARVRVATDVRPGALLVPQRAVQELQGLYSLAVVGADGTVERRMVTTGERVGGLWVIASGLRAGERVVVEGLQKARPGGTVAAELVPIEEPPPQEFGRAPPAAPGAAVPEDGE